MYVTFYHRFFLRRRVKFVNLKPTIFFLTYYNSQYSIICNLSNQKLPKIPRRELVKLL